MIRRDGERLRVAGPVTLDNVTALLREGYALLGEGVRVIDLAEVTELDSSLLAALLAWLRRARHNGIELTLANPPAGLTTIARLYGVSELLPEAAPAR